MHTTRKVLTIFIGSPGDLLEERTIARKTVDDLNTSLREIGWEIDLRGWEDILPSRGRPQEIINADVRACQLFLGLVHTRWGTPTGRYSSGFEEEFRLACELHRADGQPEIWLFFKNVPEKQLKDPGEQLRKVLDFRKEVQDSKEVLFRDFRNTKEWTLSLPKMLLQYVLRLSERSRKTSEIVPSATASSAATNDAEKTSQM